MPLLLGFEVSFEENYHIKRLGQLRDGALAPDKYLCASLLPWCYGREIVSASDAGWVCRHTCAGSLYLDRARIKHCHNVTCSPDVIPSDGSFAQPRCGQTCHRGANTRGECFPRLYWAKPTACLGAVTVHGKGSPLVLSLFLEPLGRPRLPLGRAKDSGGAAFTLAIGRITCSIRKG